MGYKKGDVVRIVRTPVTGSPLVGCTGTVTVTLGPGNTGEHDNFWVEIPGHKFPYQFDRGRVGAYDWPFLSEEVELVRASDH